MPSGLLPDPVPLGVSGVVMLPRRQYEQLVARAASGTSLLLRDDERRAYIGKRLWEAVDRPLTMPGSEGFAQLVLARFPDVDLMESFAEKVLQTLRDGRMHSRLAVAPGAPRVAVIFLAWNGSHREVQAERYGNYLGGLFGTGKGVVEGGVQIAGLLEIDAYARDTPELDDPGLSLDEVFQVAVEYSYLPGRMFGSSHEDTDDFGRRIMLNPDLCTAEERQALEKLATRAS